MRTIRFAMLPLLVPALVTAQPTPPDSIACRLASARRPAENVADDFTRLLQLTGDAPASASLIRRGADRLAVPCGPDTPFGARWYDATPDTLLELLPVRAMLTGNTAYPRGANDGTLWSGVGIAGMRSEEHTSELQSRENLVCRLLLE